MPPLLLAMAVLANAQETDKDTLAGMDAEVRGDWVEAAKAFDRALAALPADTKRALRLRYARQRGIAIWKPQVEQLMKAKRFEDAARAVTIASAIDPDDATVQSAARQLEKAGVKFAGPPADEKVSPHFPERCAAGRLRCWSVLGPPFGEATAMIDGGVRYLISTQDPNGFWDCDKHGGGQLYDVGITGLVLEALLVDGPGGASGDRGAAAQKAADWLVSVQSDDGVFGTKATHSFMYNHAIATEAVAEYAAISGDPDRYWKCLERSRDYILSAQNPGAGWRYEPRGNENDTSITSRVVCAFERMQLLGIQIQADSLSDAQKWIDSMVEPNYGQIGYNYPGGQPARPEGKQETFPAEESASMTAAGILATAYNGGKRAWMPKSLAILAEVLPQSRYADMYYWQVGARAWVAATGRMNADWYGALVDASKRCTKGDGGMAACDVWGQDMGRIGCTAMTVLALAAPFSEPAPKSGASSRTASDFLRGGRADVVVAAATAETPTGIYLDAGMKISAIARGTIQPWEGSPKVASDGIKAPPKSYKPLLKGAPFACLLGRIGPEGKPFRMQSEKPVTVPGHGQLYLLVNDERPEDGDGTWDIRVRLE